VGSPILYLRSECRKLGGSISQRRVLCSI
jgi:hypothetical protein